MDIDRIRLVDCRKAGVPRGVLTQGRGSSSPAGPSGSRQQLREQQATTDRLRLALCSEQLEVQATLWSVQVVVVALVAGFVAQGDAGRRRVDRADAGEPDPAGPRAETAARRDAVPSLPAAHVVDEQDGDGDTERGQPAGRGHLGPETLPPASDPVPLGRRNRHVPALLRTVLPGRKGADGAERNLGEQSTLKSAPDCGRS